jgi:hypothetical protein
MLDSLTDVRIFLAEIIACRDLARVGGVRETSGFVDPMTSETIWVTIERGFPLLLHFSISANRAGPVNRGQAISERGGRGSATSSLLYFLESRNDRLVTS